ncbi:MAG: sigma-70 family RNA polymerase sigma factor [Phycisphaerales bacterium]|nr:MAG: sigma-70 family RNA polymerase sigma factor [Phycisphaerales bacterium]
MPSDKILVQAVLTGRKTAYGQLYDRYAPLVRAVCYDASGNLADAQDLAQDVFVRAYEKLDHLHNPDCFGKWVVGIARLRCREWRRRRSREQNGRADLSTGAAAGVEPSDDHHPERLRRMIGRLGEKERLALHAFYLQGKSADEARRLVGLSRSGFYRMLGRARKQLEKLLAQELEDLR